MFKEEQRLQKAQKLGDVKQKVVVEYQGNCLTMQSLMSILDQAPDIAFEDYAKKTLKNRKRKRGVF